MAEQQFSITSYPISLLVGLIDSGELGLPDLQRPFVWNRAKVRDLFDSLYRGYPAGYFLLWSTPADVQSHRIGSDRSSNGSRKMIVDGQQRLTSLYAVTTGKEIINEDNERQNLRIAFNPLTQEFAVANAATDSDTEWLSNISLVWLAAGGTWEFTNEFIAGLRESRDLEPGEEQQIGQALGRLAGLTGYQFSALELSSELDIEVVAEIFQRINSAGVSLNSADFILTLMSVYWVEGRHQLEDFARKAKKPSTGGASPYNHFHQPSPDELLRVAVGLGLRRGVLQNAYQVLRGRNPESREISEELREARFRDLEQAQTQVLELTNWHEYMVALKQAGFRSGSMLTSTNNFLYGYLIYLIGRSEFMVGKSELRDVIARWFFMSSLTGRYTGSPETIVESDLRRIYEASTATDFVSTLDAIIENQLTDDFWEVNLPDHLDSSASWSPYLFAYYAALNLLDAKALFSKIPISTLLDPGVVSTKSPVERHHLFPKAYLSSIGITGTVKTNQIANFAFMEWSDNVQISDREPREYFPEYFARLSSQEQTDAVFHHALPPGWEEMEYSDFLADRRQRIARVVRAGFELLKHGPKASAAHHELPTVGDLLRQMETFKVEFKKSARVPDNPEVQEKAINEGIIKSVAGFMNAEGGTLAIGITDDGDVTGIQQDLDVKHHDIDGYQNWLITLLINAMGESVVAAYTSVRFETVGNEIVCLVDVKRSHTQVFASTFKGSDIFYVRVGNTTRVLTGPQIVDYVAKRFN